MTNIKYYRGSFTKATGELRTMFFVRSEDLPSTFVESNTKGTEEVVSFQSDEDILNNFNNSNTQGTQNG